MVTTESRQRIVDAAQVLFNARGYAGVGVRDVCRRAGVKRGSFYHHFQSKQELLLVVLETQEECCRDLLRVAGEGSSAADRVRILFTFAEKKFRLQQASEGRVLGCPFGVLVSGKALEDEVIGQRLSGCQHRLTEWIQEEILDSDDVAGKDEEEKRLRARSLLAYYQGVATLARGLDAPELVARLVEGAVCLVGGDTHGSC